jgi:succinate dehydrogenase / fumarate reductase membrane anchor subunit
MSQNYGTKRIVTGAHYGLRDWMAQRVTAVLMALFTIVLLAQVIFGGPSGLRQAGRASSRRSG